MPTCCNAGIYDPKQPKPAQFSLKKLARFALTFLGTQLGASTLIIVREETVEKKRRDWERALNAMLGLSASADEPQAGLAVKKCILIVDDDPAIRQILSHLLAEEGYQTRTASNGSEALATIDAAIDLVLLDLQMPGKDGWETFESLTCKHPWLPTILITARTNQFFPAMATGVDALLEKPLDLRRLLDTIRTLLAETLEARAARLKNRPATFEFIPSNSDEPGGSKQ